MQFRSQCYHKKTPRYQTYVIKGLDAYEELLAVDSECVHTLHVLVVIERVTPVADQISDSSNPHIQDYARELLA